jgi:hypothetical protein
LVNRRDPHPPLIAHDELAETLDEQELDCAESSSFDPGSGYFTSSTFKDLALTAAVLLGIIIIGMAISWQ